jgi:ADP-ribose pyrophosphatase
MSGSSEFQRLDSRVAFDGKIFQVHVDRVKFPNGNTVNLEVVRHPRSVVLIPMPDRDHVVLVRQYRYPVDQWLWELPAGSLDPGEEPEAAAARECHEEIGKVPRQSVLVGSFLPTPGYCDEEMLVFRLDGLEEPRGEAEMDEDEIIEPKVFSVTDALAMVTRGEIRDMKTVVGLGLAHR